MRQAAGAGGIGLGRILAHHAQPGPPQSHAGQRAPYGPPGAVGGRGRGQNMRYHHAGFSAEAGWRPRQRGRKGSVWSAGTGPPGRAMDAPPISEP